MSFCTKKELIEEGDTVILYLSINKIHALDVQPQIINKKGKLVENVFQATPYGALRIRDLIGKRFGVKINLSNGWGYILQPTPELWTLTLPHRTQIIYTPDISMILFQLEVVPGSIVIEAGTGSGSLSHAFIRSIMPHGHLHTFDFHEKRAETARAEFEQHGLKDFVTVRHRDVCELGFTEELNDKADVVFLDLPSPWTAVPHAINSIKPIGGRICTFSPCIEQVQRTCTEMNNHNFIDVKTMEVLQTQYSVQMRAQKVVDLEFVKTPKTDEEKHKAKVEKVLCCVAPTTQPGHTGYLTFATLLPKWLKRHELDVEKTKGEKTEEMELDTEFVASCSEGS